MSVSLRSAFNLSSFPPPGFVNIADDHEPGKNHCDASLMDKKNRDCKRSAIFHRRPTRRGNWFNRALMCRTREGTKEGTLLSPTDPVLEGNHFANTRVIPAAEHITPRRSDGRSPSSAHVPLPSLIVHKLALLTAKTFAVLKRTRKRKRKEAK